MLAVRPLNDVDTHPGFCQATQVPLAVSALGHNDYYNAQKGLKNGSVS